MTDELKRIGEALVAHCRNGTEAEGLAALYAEDAVSVEAMDMGQGREAQGLEAIRGKHAWWESAMEVHESTADGPYPHGPDRFGVIFTADATNRESGERHAMKEIAIYTVRDGKIVREEFFYG
ncbi:hypothetical protein LNKW23_25480 [Paralimibaculum aggregatum]|uniref:SnoaL-like domain-containing protein n=2 Tax=Paralimibaculum aggregatum TaxID=3036245 RepID=A0ABQ6LR31_9RHOB|nr:nuclear transport factor 2 family protein [Limibaculum sp. NKW23]GMG83335.1 hypothetical protein LNKW23_25480 [Limibaculum sp. NKW23]